MQLWIGVLLIGALIILWLMLTNINLLLSLQRTPAEPRTRSEFYFILFLGAQMSGATKLMEYMKGGSRKCLLGVLGAAVVWVAFSMTIKLVRYFDRATSDTVLCLFLLLAVEQIIAIFAVMHYSNSRDSRTT